MGTIGTETENTSDVETDDKHDGQDGRDCGDQFTGTIAERHCVASSCEYGRSCINSGSEPDASGHVPSCTTCWQGHASLTSSGGAKRGHPSLWREASRKIASKSVYGLLLAMEGEEGGVATGAIGSSKFFDMIVREVVFPMMEKMGVPDRVWKLQDSFVFHLKRLFC